MSDMYMTDKQAAQTLQVSVSTIRAWRRDGILAYVKVRRSVRIKQSDLEKIMEYRVNA